MVQEEHSQAARKNAPCSGIVYVHKRDDTTLIASEIAKVRRYSCIVWVIAFLYR